MLLGPGLAPPIQVTTYGRSDRDPESGPGPVLESAQAEEINAS